MSLQAGLERRWYGRPGWLLSLLPLEWLYRATVALRRCAYRFGLLSIWRAPVPVLIVGNIAVGGTGKTPLTIALCKALRAEGFSPGIISRGYGAQPPAFPYAVKANSPVRASGDEPLLLARRSGCPVVIAPRRADAARYLLQQVAQQSPCDILISDDGLQHYALARDIELAVIDGARGCGNGHCLPVGPLRETTARLARVDAVLTNGELQAGLPLRLPAQYRLDLRPTVVVHMASGREQDAAAWIAAQPRMHALAGIGNPQRFFATLRQLGGAPIEHTFPDHHVFNAADLRFDDALPVLMTEKDAVKCESFLTLAAADNAVDSAANSFWYLRVEAELPDSLLTLITGKLRALKPS